MKHPATDHDPVLRHLRQLQEDAQHDHPVFGLSVFRLPRFPRHAADGDGDALAYWHGESEPPFVAWPRAAVFKAEGPLGGIGVRYWMRASPFAEHYGDAAVLLDFAGELLLPDEHRPHPAHVALALVKLAAGRWGNQLWVRGTWDDGHAAEAWVKSQHLDELEWDDQRNPSRFGPSCWRVDSMPKKSGFLRRNWWWVDISDLAALGLSLLPTIERRRRKTILGGSDWQAVMALIGADIDAGKLPPTTSRKALSLRYGVSQATVRKAISNNPRFIAYFPPLRQSVDATTDYPIAAAVPAAAVTGSLEEERESVVDVLVSKFGQTPGEAKVFAERYDDIPSLFEAVSELEKPREGATS